MIKILLFLSRITMGENQITEQQVDDLILELLAKHSDSVIVNIEDFLDLLKNSLSLNTMEKKRVIDAVPTLSQFQFDELIKVFSEEREKFKELAGEHPDDIKKLLFKQQSEWTQLGELYTVEEESKEKSNEDDKKIEDIKAGLGL